MRAHRLCLSIVVSGAMMAAAYGGEADAIRRPGQFRVSSEVVQSEMGPFAAVVVAFGNSLMFRGGGFEPIVFRNMMITTESASDRVVASPEAIGHFDTLREGFLDQATVRVYRIADGAFKLVREDQVPTGGFHASGWIPVLREGQIVPVGTTRFTFRWNTWNRPQVRYYFAVQAVDQDGNLSAPSNVFSVERPDKVLGGNSSNETIEFSPNKAKFLLNSVLNSITGPSGTHIPAPERLRGAISADGALSLAWDPAKGAGIIGYRVLRSDYPPAEHQGYYIQLAKKTAVVEERIRAGDMVVLSKTFHSFSRNRYLSNRVWGADREFRQYLPGLVTFFPDENPDKAYWELVPHGTTTVVEEAGGTFLRLKLGEGAKQLIGAYNHSGTAQNWYEVLEERTYRVEVWLRKKGSGTVRFRTTGYYDDRTHYIAPVALAAGSDWKKFSFEFTPPSINLGGSPGGMFLEFSGAGTFDVDNFRIYRADADYLDLLPEDYKELQAAHLSVLRTQGMIGWGDDGRRSYDVEQLTNPGGVISGSQRGNTLPQTLAVLRKAQVRPWLQIKFHLSAEEWLNLIEYLAAPYDPKRDTPVIKPWAYKRYSQGQQKPWVDEFDKIYLEIGNETWNGTYSPWVFRGMTDAVSGRRYAAGQVYGLFQEYVRSILTKSPYWQSARLDKKFQFVLGGWHNQSYGRDAASTSKSSDLMTVAAYNGGSDVAEGAPRLTEESLFRVLTEAPQAAIPAAIKHAREAAAINGERGSQSRKLSPAVYEAGPGYVLDGLNGMHVDKAQAVEQEQVMKSLAAGTATLDAFLARASLGFEPQNFFTFGRAGTEWTSHAKWYRGGQAYPSWQLLSLFNREATGDFVRVSTLSTPTADLPAFGKRHKMLEAPLVGVYATKRANRMCLFVLSRKVPNFPVAGDDGYTPVTVELPFEHATSVTLFRMAGAPRANNVDGNHVRIEQMSIPPERLRRRFSLDANTGADERGLPPAAAFLYIFDGIPTAAMRWQQRK